MHPRGDVVGTRLSVRWSTRALRCIGVARSWGAMLIASMAMIAPAAHADQERLDADAAALERLSGSLRLDRLSWHVAERRFDQATTPEAREAVARDLVRVIEPMAEAADPELAEALAQRLERILDQFATVHVDAPGMACVARLLEASSQVIGRLRAGDEVPATDVATAIGWASRAESLSDAMIEDLGSRTPAGFEQLLRSRLAWSRLQGAWLRAQGEGRGVEDLAESAIRPLAEVLEIDGRTPKPEEVSVDLRSNEVFAWAIVGMAQARALLPRGGASDAMRWLELCDDPVTAPAVRSAAMEWRLQVCLDARDWTRARVLLTGAGQVPQGLSLRWRAWHDVPRGVVRPIRKRFAWSKRRFRCCSPRVAATWSRGSRRRCLHRGRVASCRHSVRWPRQRAIDRPRPMRCAARQRARSVLQRAPRAQPRAR